MHYNGRWEAHVASQKLETKQVDEIKEKIVELEDNGTELKDYTWLSQVCVPVCHTSLHSHCFCAPGPVFFHAVMWNNGLFVKAVEMIWGTLQKM